MHGCLSEGEFTPKKRKVTWGPGQCAVCGTTGEVIAAGGFLGKTFGSWQELSRYNTASMLCAPCLWAFKDPQLLRAPLVVEDDIAKFVTWKEAAQRLLNSPVTSREALVLPHGGRKIVAPYARWGHVTADHATFVWEPRHRKALYVCRQLHKVGVRGSLLSSPRFPFTQASALTERQQEAVRAMWEFIRFVREDKTRIGLFEKLSMNMEGIK